MDNNGNETDQSLNENGVEPATPQNEEVKAP